MPRACSGSGEALSGIDESQERRKETGERERRRMVKGGVSAALRAGAIYWRTRAKMKAFAAV